MNAPTLAAPAATCLDRVHHALALLGATTIIVAVDVVAAWCLLPHFRHAVRPLIAFLTGCDPFG